MSKDYFEKTYKLMAKTIKNLENLEESKVKEKYLNEAYQKFEEFYT